MSDRVKGLIVTLDKDYHEDDIDAIANAILQLKGVIDVTYSITNSDDFINRIKITNEIKNKLYECIDDIK